MKNLGFLSIIAIALGLMAFTPDHKSDNKKRIHVCSSDSKLDFDLVNKTGYDIESIFVSPTTEKAWGEDIMGKDLLKDGETVEISFDPGETDKLWDIYVTWHGYDASEDVYWVGFDLSKISEITLFYEHETGKTWATTK